MIWKFQKINLTQIKVRLSNTLQTFISTNFQIVYKLEKINIKQKRYQAITSIRQKVNKGAKIWEHKITQFLIQIITKDGNKILQIMETNQLIPMMNITIGITSR